MGNFDAETIVVPERANSGSNDFLTGMLASACQSKGIDPSAVVALCNNKNGNGFNGFGLDGIIALIVVAAIFGNGNAIGPVNAGLAALNGKIAGIECRLPETKVIPCADNYVRVNTDLNIPVHFGANYCGNGYPYGGYPYGLCGNNGGWG